MKRKTHFSKSINIFGGALGGRKMKRGKLPERAMATFSTPPSGSRASLALLPNNFSRQLGPWDANSDWRKDAVSSTGGLLAVEGKRYFIDNLCIIPVMRCGFVICVGMTIYQLRYFLPNYQWNLAVESQYSFSLCFRLCMFNAMFDRHQHCEAT